MPNVKFREFQYTRKYTATGSLALDDVYLTDACSMQVQLTQVLQINTLAAQMHRKMAYRVLQHELRLILSFLYSSPAGMLVARGSDLLASARQIGSFFTESVGLGMLTAAMRARCGWNGGHQDLDHFDVHPTPPSMTRFSRKGIRPDLMFSFKHQSPSSIAGEARGRARKQPRLDHTYSEQRGRLNEMLDWSGRYQSHPVTMAYTFIKGPHIAVDLFVPASAEPLPYPDEPVGGTGPPRPRNRDPHRRTPDFDRLVDNIVTPDNESGSPDGAEALYETAPTSDRIQYLEGREVRGDWVTADLITQSSTRLFIGVLPDELRPSTQAAANSLQDPEDPISINLFGRVLLATAEGIRSPSWSDISERLSQ
ncbi:hypothetical protein [Amycolatopsis sp. NPDC004079]|uniref:hypothetical protein n=1 Tax=Amycolatopsis sp. NPDC004079 TaxID=3154549 RepID=UPI0033A0691B